MPLKVTRDPNDLRSSLNREFSVVRLQRRTSMTRFERRASIENSNTRVHNMKVDDGMNSTNNARFANLIDDSGDKMMRRSFLHQSKSFRGNTLNASEMKEDSDDDDDDEFEQKVFKPRRESLLHAKSRQSLVLPTDMSKDIAAMLLELVDEEDEKEDSSSLDNSSSDNDDTKYDKSRSTTTATGRRNSTISFTKVIIKEYPYALGDNPGGGQGVPLTIEWEPMTTEVIDFDEYELLREKDRRVLHQLKIPRKDRVDILLNAGYTLTQITTAINYVKNLRNQRLQTKQTLYNMVKDERNEKVKKKVKNFFTGYKKKERKYIEHSLSFTFMYIENDDTSNGDFIHRKTEKAQSLTAHRFSGGITHHSTKNNDHHHHHEQEQEQEHGHTKMNKEISELEEDKEVVAAVLLSKDDNEDQSYGYDHNAGLLVSSTFTFSSYHNNNVHDHDHGHNDDAEEDEDTDTDNNDQDQKEALMYGYDQ